MNVLIPRRRRRRPSRRARRAPRRSRPDTRRAGRRSRGDVTANDTSFDASVRVGFDRAGKGKPTERGGEPLTGRRRAFVARTGPGVVVFLFLRLRSRRHRPRPAPPPGSGRRARRFRPTQLARFGILLQPQLEDTNAHVVVVVVHVAAYSRSEATVVERSFVRELDRSRTRDLARSCIDARSRALDDRSPRTGRARG